MKFPPEGIRIKFVHQHIAPRLIIYHHIPKAGGSFIIKKLADIFNSCRFSFQDAELAGFEEIKKGLYARLGRSGTRRFLESINWDNHEGKGIEFVTSHDMFDPRHFQKRDEDFYFTFMRHPVDRCYSSIYYMKRVTKTSLLPEYKRVKETWGLPLDVLIDRLLQQPFESRYDPQSLAKLDFVGVTEEMDRSLKVLNGVLGTRIKNDERINANEGEDYSYRRDELERHFREEIKIYDDYREKLLKTGYQNLSRRFKRFLSK